MSFSEIVQNIDTLTFEEKLELSNILTNQVKRYKTNLLDKEIEIAENELKNGQFKSGSVDDLIKELELSIE